MPPDPLLKTQFQRGCFRADQTLAPGQLNKLKDCVIRTLGALLVFTINNEKSIHMTSWRCCVMLHLIALLPWFVNVQHNAASSSCWTSTSDCLARTDDFTKFMIRVPGVAVWSRFTGVYRSDVASTQNPSVWPNKPGTLKTRHCVELRLSCRSGANYMDQWPVVHEIV